MAYKDPDKQRAYQREWARRRAAKAQEAKNELKDACAVCGETEKCCLEFHHKDPRTKSFSIGRSWWKKDNGYQTPEAIREEAKKCMILCANCHRKFHAGVIELG